MHIPREAHESSMKPAGVRAHTVDIITLVTTDRAAAAQLLTTIVYQEKTPPSLIRLGGISLDIQLW